MECFETFAAAVADFYAIHPPFLPKPNGDECTQTYYVRENPIQESNAGSSDGYLSSIQLCICIS